jgi:hypothetical protein
MRIGNKAKVAIVELGMLGGIGVAFYTAPETIPLRTFLIISGAVLALGNVLLFARIRRTNSSQTNRRGRAWPHLLTAFAILALAWLLILLLDRL